MVRTSDRIIVLGLLVIGVSIIGLFALLQHHEKNAIEPVWSSRQQTSVVTGAVGSSAATTNVDSGIANSGERGDIDAGKSGTMETASGVVGPDAGDELDTSPREERSQAPIVGKRVLPPATTRALPTITRPAEHKRVAPQSNERAASARDIPAASEPSDGDTGRSESLSRDAMVPAQPAMANPARPTLPADQTTQPAMQSQPGPVDALPPVPATPRPRSRQDVQDELRKARSNGSLPRFGNPDPYGPGGSPSTGDR